MSVSSVQLPSLVHRDWSFSPTDLARGMRHLPGMVFLDSSRAEWEESRQDASHSLIAADPAKVVCGKIHDPNDRKTLGKHLNTFRNDGEHDRGFPLGGAIGWVDYDGRFTFGFYPEMLIFDHHSERWFEIGGLSEKVDWCEVESPLDKKVPELTFNSPTGSEDFCRWVERVREYIAAGDIYQVNLSHRFTADWPLAGAGNAFPLYERLRDVSPAPFSAFLHLGERQILSTSPELFLRISGSSIRTRPIKGTRPRFRDPARDEKSAYDLLTSPKEVAELIMITDLERNDLGQICEFGSVRASDLLKLERYEQVFHLVSTVEGQLRPDVGHLEALAACFPGGSITGAPKKRAREIIAELEPEPRGLYTGAIGILGFNGESRFNIAIRTAIVEDGAFHFHAGAGIVADSVPAKEYEETLHKAAGIFQACGAESGFRFNRVESES